VPWRLVQRSTVWPATVEKDAETCSKEFSTGRESISIGAAYRQCACDRCRSGVPFGSRPSPLGGPPQPRQLRSCHGAASGWAPVEQCLTPPVAGVGTSRTFADTALATLMMSRLVIGSPCVSGIRDHHRVQKGAPTARWESNSVCRTCVNGGRVDGGRPGARRRSRACRSL
jgi:hypothetical protein